MSLNKQNLPGIILAVVFAALALFAFTRQQLSATSEATAVANAYSAATSWRTISARALPCMPWRICPI